jgi:hypothetical protein
VDEDMKMTCSRVALLLVDLARGIEPAPHRMEILEAHLRECPDCERRLERERGMSASLRALAVATAVGPWDAASEAALLVAFDGAQTRRRSPRRWFVSVAAAAALLTVATTAVVRHRAPAVVTPPPAIAAASAQVAAARETAFVVWPGAADLPTFESGQLMRVELPASVALSLGLAPSGRAVVVQADVLVGQDGFARAVRLAP